MDTKKGALQISFGWLFAIIVGMFIIFLAIYGVIKLMNTEQTTLDVKTGKQIGVLLNPLETSFESAKTSSFTLPAESRIYNGCNDEGNFGKQLISISQKSFNKWTETNLNASFTNKYIFSKRIVEGKKFYIFSKPFDFPFKVSDLIYMTSSEEVYCFPDAWGDIEEELSNLNQENLLLENCTEEMIYVCFGGNCDINVNYQDGTVEKDGEIMYFSSDALMYAAIFSDVAVYECQLKRLMKRVGELSLLYGDKSILIGNAGCDLEIKTDLAELIVLAGNLDESQDILGLTTNVENLNEKNDAGGDCKLW